MYFDRDRRPGCGLSVTAACNDTASRFLRFVFAGRCTSSESVSGRRSILDRLYLRPGYRSEEVIGR